MDTRRRTRAFWLALLFIGPTVAPVPAQARIASSDSSPFVHAVCADTLAVPRPPAVRYARQAAVLDFESDTLLFGYDHHALRPPASLTKLVTIYTALSAAEEGTFSRSRPEEIHPAAYASAMEPGSSLMFLGPDQFVTGDELLIGLAVSSGNDAAVEVALRVAGSIGLFSARMNQAMVEAGYDRFYFEEPSGLSPANRISAADFARFSADLLRRWPETTRTLFGLRDFTFPEARHYPAGGGSGSIRQANRNGLLRTYPGADGLKTGFIEESGYNLAATAVRDGRRLVVVVLGVEATSHAEGGRLREYEASALLDWGFAAYESVNVAVPPFDAVRVWGGDVATARLDPIAPPALVLPRGVAGEVRGEIEQIRHVWAPLEAGTHVGTVRYLAGECTIHEVPIVVGEAVPAAGAVRRVVDRLRWWWFRLFG